MNKKDYTEIVCGTVLCVAGMWLAYFVIRIFA